MGKKKVAKKFQKNPQKQYLRKFRVYPIFLFLYKHMDKWLSKMSLKGWHIVDCGIFTFLFEKGEPQEKVYFTYAEFDQKAEYSIMLRYPMLEKTYGLKKSKINQNKTKKMSIVEIDTEKIDVSNNVGYKELIYDRNRLYLKYSIVFYPVGLLSLIVMLRMIFW